MSDPVALRDSIVNPDGTVPPVDTKPPRQWRMKQPVKDELRRQLEVANAQATLWKCRYDDVVAKLEGEGKSFGLGFLCCGLCGVVIWLVAR